jgi:heme-degrading monooxygenase HmoA
MSLIANTPKAPYFAVIFSSVKRNDEGYADTAELMIKLASEQNGFLGIESAREALGITVSYWDNLISIKQWKAQVDHQQAQRKGKSDWYESYKVRIAKVERDYGFGDVS